ncbi:protein SERAC1 [Zerene cesonia]|uniref:protein SERAC1 n=1 Tax=Zerene cesonia TaxID=33412 RepID=UPI0018E53471|nr:protein SERAC1 [Zerene cesonia]
MAASGNVTLAKDGARLHPYLVALVRWCISSFWSTASILIHRLLTTPLPPIAASKPPKRPASSEHLHPEPRVDCVVLHQPADHEIDVIFVHGLYGSLGNTWKQGEWRSKYKDAPQKQPLRRHCDADERNKRADTSKNDREKKKRRYTRLDEAKLRNELSHMLKKEKQNSLCIPEYSIEPSRRASLWQNSAGFMFYSVPHRGSPLADIKTPITARSIELLEICNNCSLLLSLQERWLVATQGARPAVRSLVETGRTLMSVLWLRIVSVDSADPGRGALYGVSVDHREICKPTSRNCLLYTELMHLMSTALSKKTKVSVIDHDF